MYIVNDLKLVFLAQPRVASNAIRDWLQRLPFKCAHANGHHGQDNRKLEVLRASGYEIFSLVRNPWDTLVSFWYQQYGKIQPTAQVFETWLPLFIDEGQFTYPADAPVKKYGSRGQSAAAGERILFPRVDASSSVYHYECLPGCLYTLISERMKVVGQTEEIAVPELHRVNASTPSGLLPVRSHWSDYYTRDTFELVRRRFRCEILRYQYGDVEIAEEVA